MPTGYPDWQGRVRIAAVEVATLPVDIKAQTISTVGVDIKSQTLDKVDVNLAGQAITVGIDIDAQSVAIHMTRDWSALQALDKNFYGSAAAANATYVTLIDYVVPPAKPCI